jgi:hypothetical protein
VVKKVANAVWKKFKQGAVSIKEAKNYSSSFKGNRGKSN